MRFTAVRASGWLAKATLMAALGLAAATPWLASAAAETPAAKPAKALTEAEKAAALSYDQLVDSYLKNDFPNFETALKSATLHELKMTPSQRIDVEYIRKSIVEQRPKWWASTKSPDNISFQCSIWGKNVTTNYIPADALGFEKPVGIRDGQLVMVVVWRPTYVDNPRLADGALAKTLKVTKGDIGEVVVWHELGHLYMTSQLSSDAVLELYSKYRNLFSHLQEFFADMTAIAHCSPHARRVALVLRLDAIDPPDGKYDEMEAHTRAGNAIGSMFLAEVLSNRAKWPNVHLPGEIPDHDVELKTIIYMYEHFAPEWTLAEDKAMRDWATVAVRTQGDQIFHSKGMIPLPGKNTFSLMEAQDREAQKKRDAWVTAKLKEFIAAGQTDKPQPKPKNVIRVNGREIRTDALRIETPDY